MKRHPMIGALLFLMAGAAVAEEAADSFPAFTPPDRALFAAGEFVYARYCVVCHDERGDGAGEMAATLSVKPRAFRSGTFKYRSTPWGKLPTTSDLLRTIRGGRTGTAMGAFTELSEEEARAVAEYVKSFSRKWRKPENYAAPVEIPQEPAWLREPAALEAHAVEGGKIFAANCAACHGERADGQGAAAAALRDEWGQPAQPANLRQPHLRSGDELRDIFRVLMTGLNGTPMASFADALTTEQKWEVIAFIKTLRRKSGL